MREESELMRTSASLTCSLICGYSGTLAPSRSATRSKKKNDEPFEAKRQFWRQSFIDYDRAGKWSSG